MTEIENYTAPAAPAAANPNPGYDLIRATAQAMSDANAIATAVCRTEMVPAHFRGKPDDLTAAILYGATLGFDPMQSARQVYIVHGQAGLYARSMAALVLSAGHQVWTVESADDGVTVAGKRRGSEHVEQSTWTPRRAQLAGYTNNKKYDTDPQAMLYAKALSEVCRKIAPDVLNGVYAVEELQMERFDEPTPAAAPSGAADRLRAALRPEPEPTVTAEHVEPEPDGQALLNTSSALAKAMFASMREAGIGKDQAHEFLSEVTGREITSSKDLTEDEARRVLDHLPQQPEDPQ